MVASPKWLKDLTNEEVRQGLAPFRFPLELACYHTNNYFNLGSMIRTAHNFMCRKLYAVDMDGKYYKKATMGARKYEDIDKCTLEEFLVKARNRNLVVFEHRPGLISESLCYFEWPEEPIMFFGDEKFGVPDEVLNVASHVVSIPVMGVLNDFNVAVAAGVAAYDWFSKYHR